MEKFKKLLILPAIALILCFSFMAGPARTALALPLNDINAAANSFRLPPFKTTYKKGSEVDFSGPAGFTGLNGVTITVKDPVGRTIDATSSKKFVLNMAGYYAVKFTKGDTVLDSILIKSVTDNAEIRIKANGADIPTYIDVDGDNIQFTLPEAEMVVWEDVAASKINEQETAEAQADYTFTYEVLGPDGQAITVTDDNGVKKVASNKGKGTYLVKYIATGTSKTVTKTFTVNAIEDFSDTEKPKLSILSMPNSLPQRVKYTLPKATATDNYDENVKITVEVLDPQKNPVKVVDDSDPDNLVLTNDAVAFDNDIVRDFYPWEAGTYQVKYTAIDDAGNKAESIYNISVADTRAPVIDADSIPKSVKWGLKVTDAQGNINAPLPLYINIPKVTDNVAEVNENLVSNETPTKAEVRLSFTVKNPDNTTIFNSTDKLADEFVEYQPANSANNPTSKARIKFNFGSDTLTKKTGQFTLTFTARDTDANGSFNTLSSKIVTINVDDTFVDKSAPEVDVTKVPAYIFAGEKFIEPVISIWDMYGEGSDKETESADIVKEINYTFVPADISKDPEDFNFEEKSFVKFDEPGEIRISITAYDSVGNVNNKYTAAGDGEIVIKVFGSGDDDIDLGIQNGITATGSWVVDDGGVKVQVTDDNFIVIPELKFTAPAHPNNFLGYELIVKGKNNQAVETTVYSYTLDGAVNDTLVLQNIMFETSSNEVYTVTLRVFKINGESFVTGTKFDMAEVADNKVTVSSPAEPTNISKRSLSVGNLEVLEGYKLPSNESIAITTNYKKITATSYALQGNILIPKYAGESFLFDLYEFDGTEFAKVDTGDDAGKVIVYSSANEENEVVMAVNTSKVEVGVLGNTVQYARKWTEDLAKEYRDQNAPNEVTPAEVAALYVQIPDIDKYFDKAFAMNGNQSQNPDYNYTLEVTVTVTDRNGKSYQIYDADGNALGDKTTKFVTDPGAKFFRPSEDGKFTITYKYGNETFTLSVLVGDLIMPTIENVSALTPAATYPKGHKFVFGDVEAKDNVTATDKLTINKKLYSPSNTLLTPQVDDDGKEYVELNDSGTYKLVYEVIDEAGNKNIKQFTFTVSAQATPVNLELISTVLIIAGVLLIAGMLVYFLRFRPVKEV